MSNASNVRLLERAAEMMDFWEGTPWAEKLEALIDQNDLGELNHMVILAESEATIEEFGRRV